MLCFRVSIVLYCQHPMTRFPKNTMKHETIKPICGHFAGVDWTKLYLKVFLTFCLVVTQQRYCFIHCIFKKWTRLRMYFLNLLFDDKENSGLETKGRKHLCACLMNTYITYFFICYILYPFFRIEIEII